MTKNEIATNYLEYLENGDVERIIALFSPNGIVESPVYGCMKATLFYPKLKSDTSNSKLKLRGIFEDNETSSLALYFNYTWILKNNKKVAFNVVDILEFDAQHKISKLTIIYDTVRSRTLVEQLDS